MRDLIYLFEKDVKELFGNELDACSSLFNTLEQKLNDIGKRMALNNSNSKIALGKDENYNYSLCPTDEYYRHGRILRWSIVPKEKFDYTKDMAPEFAGWREYSVENFVNEIGKSIFQYDRNVIKSKVSGMISVLNNYLGVKLYA